MFYQSLHSAYFLNSIQVFFMLQLDPFDYCCIICTCACMVHNFYLAIWKSRHWQLGIGISISICIGIAKILVSAYEFFFLESRTFMSNTPKYSLLCLVISANLLFLRSESWLSLYTDYIEVALVRILLSASEIAC